MDPPKKAFPGAFKAEELWPGGWVKDNMLWWEAWQGTEHYITWPAVELRGISHHSATSGPSSPSSAGATDSQGPHERIKEDARIRQGWCPSWRGRHHWLQSAQQWQRAYRVLTLDGVFSPRAAWNGPGARWVNYWYIVFFRFWWKFINTAYVRLLIIPTLHGTLPNGHAMLESNLTR